MFDNLLRLIDDGGPIAGFLLLEMLVLWWLLGARYVQLYFSPQTPRALVTSLDLLSGDVLVRAAKEMVERPQEELRFVLSKYLKRSMAYRKIIIFLIVVALSMALLDALWVLMDVADILNGDVFFQSKKDFSTTQLGVLVATPATVVLRILDSKAADLRLHLHNLYAFLSKDM